MTSYPERHLFVMAENLTTAEPYVNAFDNKSLDKPDWAFVAFGSLLMYIVEHEPPFLAFAFHESFKDHEDYNVLSVVVSDLIEKGAIVVPLPEVPSLYDEATEYLKKLALPEPKTADDVIRSWMSEYIPLPVSQDLLTYPTASLWDVLSKPEKEYEVYYIGGPADGRVFEGDATYIVPGAIVVWQRNDTTVLYHCVEATILGQEVLFLLSPDVLADSERKIREFILEDLEKI
ncbi:hypothetical protein AB0K16_21950 [Nonomuraea jabiensis]|uniref:hypothetical protein n=1 Tax=Nonomuraea jabiensis TaxID=882448 RepID=UPI00341353C3